ncbi:DUF2157 domain-containing protein [Sphingobacterium hungaricum]
MNKIQREDLSIVRQYSNLNEKEIESILEESIYAKKDDWQKFLRLFFIVLGIGFTIAGIIFFFAYNWADLNKFVKLGLTQGLLIVTTLFAIYPKLNSQLRKIVLTAASVLVGVLFAVFGQIYQTGANAYDFFLAWTLFITLWVIVGNYAALYLLYLALINITLYLYANQVAQDWSFIFLLTLLFLVNTTALMAAIILPQNKEDKILPTWFLNTVALAAISFATIALAYGIVDGSLLSILPLAVFVSIAYSVGIRYGLQIKSGFYLSAIPFSVIIILSSLLFRISDDEFMFFINGLFIIGGVTLVVTNLIRLQKKWRKNEN